jgi:hypothetical protein
MAAQRFRSESNRNNGSSLRDVLLIPEGALPKRSRAGEFWGGFCKNGESRRYLSGSVVKRRWLSDGDLGQFGQQGAGCLQVRSVEAFGEPAIDFGEEGVGFGGLPLTLPETGQTGNRPQFQGFGFLLAGYTRKEASTSSMG